MKCVHLWIQPINYKINYITFTFNCSFQSPLTAMDLCNVHYRQGNTVKHISVEIQFVSKFLVTGKLIDFGLKMDHKKSTCHTSRQNCRVYW